MDGVTQAALSLKVERASFAISAPSTADVDVTPRFIGVYILDNARRKAPFDVRCLYG